MADSTYDFGPFSFITPIGMKHMPLACYPFGDQAVILEKHLGLTTLPQATRADHVDIARVPHQVRRPQNPVREFSCNIQHEQGGCNEHYLTFDLVAFVH